jgi:hypothetical protein
MAYIKFGRGVMCHSSVYMFSPASSDFCATLCIIPFDVCTEQILYQFSFVMVEVSVFLGYGAASLDDWRPTFRESVTF